MRDITVRSPDSRGPIASAETYEIRLLALGELYATEKCNVQRAASLARKILFDDAWTTPLWVDAASKVIMDGHHRFEAAGTLGFAQVPCLLLSYDMPDVAVFTWDGNDPFPPADIIAAGRSGQLLPYKTTRHVLSRPLQPVRYALDDLR